MKELIKERKVVIKKVEPFEVRFEGDSTIHPVWTEEKANEVAESLRKQEKKRVTEANDKELRAIKVNENIRLKLESFISDLIQETRSHTRHGREEISNEIKDIRAKLQKVIDNSKQEVAKEMEWRHT